MNSNRFFVYTGDPADPSNQIVRAVTAESEDCVRELFPHAITVQRYDPIDPKWRRTGEPNWAELEAGIRVL